jgi:hypothetical protein
MTTAAHRRPAGCWPVLGCRVGGVVTVADTPSPTVTGGVVTVTTPRKGGDSDDTPMGTPRPRHAPPSHPVIAPRGRGASHNAIRLAGSVSTNSLVSMLKPGEKGP